MWSVLLSHAFALHVLIDPGHGGIDKGASYYGIKESKVTLNISKYLKDLIDKDPNINATLTRKRDVKVSLKHRASKAHKAGSEIFISIHANSSPDKRAHGAEIYFENQLSADDESLFLAHREEQIYQDRELSGRPSIFRGKYPSPLSAILDDLAKTKNLEQSYTFARVLKTQWQATKDIKVKLRQAPFYVISSVNMPSVLVEVGFLSHPLESKRIRSKAYQQKVAQIIYKALKDYKEL